jgi:hypothetical protein
LLFANHRVVQEVATAAAIGLWDAGAKQAGGAGLVPDAAVGVLLGAPTFVVGHALALEEAAHLLAPLA